MTERTCIICHKQFSPYVRHAHGTQLSKTKTTCSDSCRNKANADLKRQRRREAAEKSLVGPITGEKRHNLKKVYCLAICPYCGKTHDVLLDRKPMVLPRIYCRAHEWCRDEDDEMIGGVTRRRGTRGAA
jgi:hypothetical protein